MITDFFLTIFENVTLWFLGLFGPYDGLPAEAGSAVDGVAGFFASTGDFLGALDQWFPVPAVLALFAVSITVEVGLATIRGVRKIKQLLPFQ